MEFNGRHARQILLFSLIVLIIPMILFPHRLGTGLARASMIYLMYELVFYMIVSFALTRRASLVPLAQAAGICLIYRLALGAVYGLLIAIMYSMNLRVSLTLGLSSYLPAVVLHLATAPFIMLPVLRQLGETAPTRIPATRTQTDPAQTGTAESGRTTFVTAGQDQPTQTQSRSADHDQDPFRHNLSAKQLAEQSPSAIKPSEANGFDRATKYIGEDAAVQVAAVVDNEGLLLGHFDRNDAIAEDWAPLALLFYQHNQPVVNRFGPASPESLTLNLPDKKIVIAREELFYLFVIAERHNDDLLNIRFSQGLEIVRKYVAERYGEQRAVNTENAYVRSTQ